VNDPADRKHQSMTKDNGGCIDEAQPAPPDDFVVGEAVLASLDGMRHQDLKRVVDAVETLAEVEGAVTLELCRIAGAAEAYMHHSFDRRRRPVGVRPPADAITKCARQAVERFLSPDALRIAAEFRAVHRDWQRAEVERLTKAPGARR
jgi:hypothetical protein